MTESTEQFAEMQRQLIVANERIAALEAQVAQATTSSVMISQADRQRDLEHFLQSALDAVAAHVAVLDTDGTILHVNAAWKKFAKANDAPQGIDYVGANYLEVCSSAQGANDEEAAAAADGIRRVIAGEHDTFSLEYPCHSSTENRWFTLRVTPFDDPAPHRVMVTHTSITERVLAEQEVQASHDEITSILNSVEDVVWSSTLPDNRLIYSSPSFERIFGYPAQTFLQDPTMYKKVVHPDDLPFIEQALQKAYQDGFADIEHRILLPDGRIRWVHRRTWIRYNASGQPVRVDGISSDITERKQAEEALKSIARFPEENPNIVLRLHHDGEILYANPSAAWLLKEWGCALHDQAPAFWSALAADVFSAQTAKTVEVEIQQKTWSVAAMPIPNDGYVNLYATDITERKQRELLQTRLTEVMESIASHQALPRILEHLIRAIEAYQPSIRASVLLLDPVTNQLRHGAAPSLPDSYNAAIDGIRIGSGVGSCGTAAYEKRLVVVENTQTHPFWKDFRELAAQHNLYACWSQPIFNRTGDVLGTFALYYDHPHSPTPVELELLRLAAHIAEIAITRTQEQEDLITSEARYRQMFEMHHLPKMIIDPESGAILDANPAAETFYGYPLTTLKTMSIMDINIGTSEEIHDKMQKALRGEVQSCSFRHRLADGSLRNIEIFPGPIRIDGKDVLNCIYTDVTAQKQAEAALQQAHDLLEQRVIERTAELERVKNRIEAIFNHSGDAILLLDVAHGIQQANDRFTAFFGYAEDGYHGLRLATLFHPDDADRVESIIAEVAAAHQPRQFEAHAQRLDGSFFAAEISVAEVNSGSQAVTNLVCIIRDVSERREAERRIAEERNLLHTLINAVPDFIYVKDMQHRFVLTNAANARARGYQSPEEMIGKSDFDLFTPDFAQQFFDEEEPVLREGRPLIDYEQPSLSATGGFEWALSNKVPLRSLEGEIIGLVGITHDITELKRTQRQIAEERNLLRRLIDTIPAYIYAKDTAHRFILVNATFAHRLANCTPEELVGKTDFDVFLPEKAAEFTADEDVIFRTQTPLTNKEELASQGLDLWVSTTKVPLYDIDGKLIGLVGSSHDITELKRTQRQIAEERNLLHSLINAVPDFIYVKDIQHRFLLSNAAHARARGFQTAEELVGKSDFDLFASDLAQQFYDEEEPVLREGRPLIDYEQPSLSTTGGFEWALSNKVPLRNLEGEIIGLVGITHDITELKRTQRQIAEERNLLRRLIDTIPNYIYAKDTAHRFILMNTALARALNNSTPEELIGKTDFAVFPTQQAIMFSADEEELFRTGIPILNKEEHVSRSTTWWVSTTKVPLYDLDGKIVGLVGTSHDISEQKRTEAALREALEREKELGELKSRFVSMASHEFRTPLATILAAAESIAAYREKMTPAQMDARFEKIRQQVMHMRDIMEDVLQITRIQAGKVEFVPVQADLDKLCHEIIEEFETQQGRIDYTSTGAPLITAIDLRLMRQAISNLIGNALKYSPEESLVRVQLRREDTQVVLTIQDQGIGIPQEDLKHLFEPFHRAQNVGAISGTGLGLSITKQAIDIHGGTIHLESQVDVGTTVTVILPIQNTVKHRSENKRAVSAP